MLQDLAFVLNRRCALTFDNLVFELDCNLLMKIAWELNLALKDLLIDGHGVVVVEGVDTGNHLIGQDAQCPPVNGLAMTFVEEHFGC